jgi:F-type H+-transporting ATPase subunit b
MEVLKMLNAGQLIAQIVNFLILFFLVKFFVWKKVLGVLDERRERMVKDRSLIDETKTQVERLKTEYEAKVATAHLEARARVEEAVKDGKRAAEEIKKEAQLGAHKILESARAQTRHELARAKEALKDEIVDLVLKTTEYVIEEKLTPEEDRKIAQNFLEKIEEMP